MGINVLEDSAIFFCDAGIGVIFKPIPSQLLAKESGKRYLTAQTKCTLVSLGQCTKQPNPSGAGFLPCNQGIIPLSGWKDEKTIISIQGIKILTMKACTHCLLGGKIRLQNSCNSKLVSGCSLIINKISSYHSEKDNKEYGIKESHTQETIEKQEENNKRDEGGQKEEKELIKIKDDYANCSYESCKERENCPYFLANATVNNNSLELKKNFEKERPDDNEAYMRQHTTARKEYTDYGWGFEGHHIISGNQVFIAVEKDTGKLKYGHLLKLAKMCGYDINNANNCILLPSMARREGSWGTLEDFKKEAKAFDVMDIMKRQWHLGGHAYTIPKDSLKYYKPTNQQLLMSGINEYFPNYATSVQVKLNQLKAKYARKRCWKNLNHENFRSQFLKDMDAISEEIEGILLKFGKKPKDSYPYFVSKMAVDYAYNAPITGKIILIYQKNDGTYASKFRITRKQKDDYQIIVTQNAENPEVKIEGNLLDFILYCENVMHYWIDSKVTEGLPWNTEEEKIYVREIQTESISQFALSHASELFTFLDKNEVPYQGKLARMKRRWKEVFENAVIHD